MLWIEWASFVDNFIFTFLKDNIAVLKVAQKFLRSNFSYLRFRFLVIKVKGFKGTRTDNLFIDYFDDSMLLSLIVFTIHLCQENELFFFIIDI